VPQTRTPDAHFFTEVRYKGTKTIAITPDYSEVAKLCDQWLAPKQGTDSALAMAMGHVILKRSTSITRAITSSTTAATTPTCRCW
jgi:nitrate reductase alpha subunit